MAHVTVINVNPIRYYCKNVSSLVISLSENTFHCTKSITQGTLHIYLPPYSDTFVSFCRVYRNSIDIFHQFPPISTKSKYCLRHSYFVMWSYTCTRVAVWETNLLGNWFHRLILHDCSIYQEICCCLHCASNQWKHFSDSYGVRRAIVFGSTFVYFKNET